MIEKSFRPTEKFDMAHISRVNMQYLYNDGDLYYFMDVETYEQIAVSKEDVGDSLKFVKENEEVKICSYKGNVFAIEPPLNVELEITETEPGFRAIPLPALPSPQWWRPALPYMFGFSLSRGQD